MTIEPHRIAGLFYNTPLLLTEASARTISAVILSRFDMRRGDGGESDAGKSFHAFDGTTKADGSVEIHSPRASRFVGEYRTGPDGRPTPYRVTADGTAIITVVGELVHRGAWIGASSGVNGGRIPGHRGGVKPGQWRRGGTICRGPRSGPSAYRRVRF